MTAATAIAFIGVGLTALTAAGISWSPSRRTFGLFFPGIVAGLVPWRWRAAWRRGRRRPSVPLRLRQAMLAADRRCVYCGSRDRLQLDHIRPWSLGGTTTPANLAVLCGRCNVIKSNYWPRLGARGYRPFPGHGDLAAAGAILRAERLCRFSPRRWSRLVRGTEG